ncbi:hypothetical protein AMJ44_10495 [candidate division WOR-1 bacterium DG_54_3]|uniref:Uncharacterized protein n=1 Tax=candidate division WOR-1 bacterium DG_54_3 TaxID=1703775 RepID=A0A0S7XT15_UNCSA|nr:MAG: hypothetical protein AMJ44_10495 [candidate division WOR-1 bacterium DG_54_3]
MDYIALIFMAALATSVTYILYFILNFFMEGLLQARTRIGKLFSVYLTVLILMFLFSRVVSPELHGLNMLFVFGEILIICFLILKINWGMALIFLIYSIVFGNLITLLIFIPVASLLGAGNLWQNILYYIVFALGPVLTAILAMIGKLPWIGRIGIEVRPE